MYDEIVPFPLFSRFVRAREEQFRLMKHPDGEVLLAHTHERVKMTRELARAARDDEEDTHIKNINSETLLALELQSWKLVLRVLLRNNTHSERRCIIIMR